MNSIELKALIDAWVERYIRQTVAFKPGGTLSAERLNELFNLLINQADDAAEAIAHIRDFFTAYMQDVDTKIAADIETGFLTWLGVKEAEMNAAVVQTNNATAAALLAKTNADNATAAAIAATTTTNVATTNANNATAAANTAKANADTATAAANTATTRANNVADATNLVKQYASAAANEALDAKALADTAATAANQAKANADAATAAATAATTNATTAATQANTAKTNADAATASANTAATTANTAATAANEAAAAAVTGNIAEIAGGTGTAITLADVPLVDGYVKYFRAAANNGGAATTVNGKPVYKDGTTSAPNFISGRLYAICYSATSGGRFFLKASATGTATADHVLAPQTFSSDAGTDVVGTMIDRSGAHAQATQVLAYDGLLFLQPPQGYYDGAYSVFAADPDFVPINFLATKNMFGLQGGIPVVSSDLSDSKQASQAIAFSGWDGNNYAIMKIPIDSYFQGINWIRYPEPHLLSENVKANKVIMGVPGKSTVIDTEVADALAGDIISGKKAGVDGVIVTGTMPDKNFVWSEPALLVSNPGGGIHVIPQKGYYSGDTNYAVNGGINVVDPDFLASNIKNGVNLFELVGTFTGALTYATGVVASTNAAFYATNLMGENTYFTVTIQFNPGFLPDFIIVVPTAAGTYNRTNRRVTYFRNFNTPGQATLVKGTGGNYDTYHDGDLANSGGYVRPVISSSLCHLMVDVVTSVGDTYKWFAMSFNNTTV